MASAYFILRAIRRNRSQEQSRSECHQLSTSTLLCRTCLKEGNIPIGNSTDILEALRIFGDVQIIEGESLPQHLCQECYSFLQTAINFRKTAKESDYKLRKEVNVLQSSEQINIISSASVQPQTVPKSFKCTTCNVTFKRYRELALHRKTKNHRNLKRRCSLCNKLILKSVFQRHLFRHQNNRHVVCEVCGKLFRKENLARHVQTHNSEFPFQCQMCPYRGRCIYSLSVHMKSHSGMKPFSCDICHLRFSARGNLKKHSVIHSTDRPFKCTECSKDFRRKTDLAIHLRAVHTNFKTSSKALDCKLCDTKFSSKKTLLRHEIRIHKREKRPAGRVPLYLQNDIYESQTENYDAM